MCKTKIDLVYLNLAISPLGDHFPGSLFYRFIVLSINLCLGAHFWSTTIPKRAQ